MKLLIKAAATENVLWSNFDKAPGQKFLLHINIYAYIQNYKKKNNMIISNWLGLRLMIALDIYTWQR